LSRPPALDVSSAPKEPEARASECHVGKRQYSSTYDGDEERIGGADPAGQQRHEHGLTDAETSRRVDRDEAGEPRDGERAYVEGQVLRGNCQESSRAEPEACAEQQPYGHEEERCLDRRGGGATVVGECSPRHESDCNCREDQCAPPSQQETCHRARGDRRGGELDRKGKADLADREPVGTRDSCAAGVLPDRSGDVLTQLRLEEDPCITK